MGTNYYARTPPCPNACDHCNARQTIHLGKSSAGWRFLFRADPEWPPSEAFTRWLHLALSGGIVDEYGQPCTISDLLQLIHGKSDLRSHRESLHDGWHASDGHEFYTREFS